MAAVKEKNKVIENWKESANVLVSLFKNYSDEDLVLYSNISEVPERERETARMVLNLRIAEKNQVLLEKVEGAVDKFNNSSTRIAVAMYILGLASFIAVLKSMFNS